jgi:hypothetical protein
MTSCFFGDHSARKILNTDDPESYKIVTDIMVMSWKESPAKLLLKLYCERSSLRSVIVALGIFVMSSSIIFGQTETVEKKGEKQHAFYSANPDPLRGDWQGEGGYVAQVIRAGDRILTINDLTPQVSDEGKYRANIFRKFNVPNDRPIVVLEGVLSGGTVTYSGDGWSGEIKEGHFKASKGNEAFDLQRLTGAPPTLGARAPGETIVLFDGTNMDSWAKKQGKDWLKEDGPSPWKLVEGGAMEVVPKSDCLISRKWFGDFKLHLEFRTLGGPTNSGVYLQDRYEININEVYGNPNANPCAGFENCTPKGTNPGIRCSRPPLEWQTLDVDFHAPRFDTDGNKIASARATVVLNGVTIYENRELGPLLLSAARLGEAPTGPIQLQEHGMPLQFRNIWVVETQK